jgi:asparagine synthase (glutamine-hydrolysing)
MCGICGTVGFVDRALLERMTSIITHRGPDDSGVYVSQEARVGLGNRRLSIIDLSEAGHMPMPNEDGRLWITYNGEVYNFRELRHELEDQGHRFRSNTDTEVLIHGYEEWGVSLLPKLNGMFAFALLDLRKSSSRPIVLLARDRLGIKPLYYVMAGDRLIFGSEIKSILLCSDVPRRLNVDALHKYLAFRWVPGPETMFDGIFKLSPGHYLQWESGTVAIQCYWDLSFQVEQQACESELVEEMREILRRSVARHLVSDVPLGVFLSGGLDSTTILALASEISQEPVKTYTVAYRPEDGRLEQSDEDAGFARRAARHFGADYNEIILEPDVVSLLPKIVWHLDEPVSDAAALSTYLICRSARSQLKVLLSGQGGDEIFAGYRVYLTHRLSEWVNLLPQFMRHELGLKVLAKLPRIKNSLPGISPGLVMAFHRYIQRLLENCSLSPEDRFVAAQAYCSDNNLKNLYAPDVREYLRDAVAGARHLDHFAAAPDADFLNRMLYVDVKTFLPELNLTYSDKLSSAASVEIRVPLLDAEIVEFLSRVPPEMKLHRLTSKYILKKAMRYIVPEWVIRRRKAGFGAPTRMWLRRDLREMVDDLLSEQNVRLRGYLNPAEVRRLVEQDRAGMQDYSYRVWMLLTLELWHRAFLDNQTPSEENAILTVCGVPGVLQN